MRNLVITLAIGACAVLGTSQSAAAQSEAYTGEVMTTAASYCPHGWATMDGQLLSIQDYGSLYALLGTTYGGDGFTTFALPDTRGRLIIGEGIDYPTMATLGETGTAGTPTAGGTPTLVLRHCIKLEGNFPSRP